MKMKHVSMAVAAMVMVSLRTPAFAVVYDDFGSQPTFDFGGTGIPNNAVAASTTYVGQNGAIVFGITATPRYDNPAVTNDGAGTFFAEAGGDSAHGHPEYAKWNFSFDHQVLSGDFTGYTFTLWYDSQSIAGIPLSYLNDSWNLGMGFLATVGFDPFATKVYDLGIDLVNTRGRTVDAVAIDVKAGGSAPVSSVPDAASSLGLMLIGLGGLAAFQIKYGALNSLIAPNSIRSS